MDNKSIVNDLCQVAVISVLAVGYSMLGKKILQMMVRVAMLIGEALVNALAFTESSYLFHRLSADNIDAERKRHDAAIEALQKAQIEWAHKHQQRIDFINKQLRLERKAEVKFTELNDAMREYNEVFGHELPPLPREPVLSDFYTPD